MPFPPGKKMPIDLKSTTPSKLTAATLQTQLDAIGLNCKHTYTKYLDRYIKQVKDELPSGIVQSFGICDGPGSDTAVAEADASNKFLGTNLTVSSTPNWDPIVNDGNKDYVTKLEYLQNEEHFKWLKVQRGSEFTGKGIDTNNYSGRAPTVSAIKSNFVDVADNMSSIIVNGLDKNDLESIFTNAISTVTDKNDSNYNKTNSKVIFLVEGYVPGKGADGIGVLTCKWTLTIQDYKHSKDAIKHDWTLNISTWALLYYDPTPLDADYKLVHDHFGSG